MGTENSVAMTREGFTRLLYDAVTGDDEATRRLWLIVAGATFDPAAPGRIDVQLLDGSTAEITIRKFPGPNEA